MSTLSTALSQIRSLSFCRRMRWQPPGRPAGPSERPAAGGKTPMSMCTDPHSYPSRSNQFNLECRIPYPKYMAAPTAVHAISRVMADPGSPRMRCVLTAIPAHGNQGTSGTLNLVSYWACAVRASAKIAPSMAQRTAANKTRPHKNSNAPPRAIIMLATVWVVRNTEIHDLPPPPLREGRRLSAAVASATRRSVLLALHGGVVWCEWMCIGWRVWE